MPSAKRLCTVDIAMLFATAVWCFKPLPTVAQSCEYSECVATASFSQHVTMLAINSIVGGVSAGLVRLATGDHISEVFVDGFLRGAFGGGITYAGRGVAARTFSGAGLLGRQIAALGVSTTTNAADGIGFFDRFVLPLGPLPGRLVVSRQDSRLSVHPQADLISTAAVIYGLADPDYNLDWGKSLSGGVAVFRQRSPFPDDATLQDIYAARAEAKARARALGSSVAGATTVGGATFVSYLAPDERVLAHERVHTIQFDVFVGALGDRVDTWALVRRTDIDRWLKMNLVPAFFGGINQLLLVHMNYENMPWEREAALLSGYR